MEKFSESAFGLSALMLCFTIFMVAIGVLEEDMWRILGNMAFAVFWVILVVVDIMHYYDDKAKKEADRTWPRP